MMVTHVVLWCFALMSGVSAGISRSTPPPLPGFEPTENFALLVIDMQNGFKMGKNNSRILAVAGQVLQIPMHFNTHCSSTHCA